MVDTGMIAQLRDLRTFISRRPRPGHGSYNVIKVREPYKTDPRITKE
jgi:hypothetical protein